MADLSRFTEFYKLADVLIAKASKEELAECARLLALNLAHYQGIYGEIPLIDTSAIVDALEPNDEQAKLLARWNGDSGRGAGQRAQRAGG